MYIVYVLQRCVFHCQANIFTNEVAADSVETDKDDNEDGEDNKLPLIATPSKHLVQCNQEFSVWI